MKRLIGILIFSLLLIGKVCPQQFGFTNYSINEGLSQSVVNCIFQDSKGYIWLGTQNGLDRFDGRDFKLFRFNPADSNSISNNWIYAISEDNDGNLWIGTKGGLHKYFRTENRFERIHFKTDLQSNITEYIYDNICLKNGKILINTPPVISIYDPVAESHQNYTTHFPYDPSVKDVKIPVLESKSGIVWIGSPNGLASFDPELKEFTYYTFKTIGGAVFNEANVTALYQDKTQRIWVGTDAGLFMVNNSLGMAEEVQFELESGKSFLFATFIRNLVQDKTGNLLIATEGNGLYLVSAASESTNSIQNFTLENSQIGHNIVQCLLIDKSENLWIGTLSGVSKTDLKKKKFKLYRNTYRPDATNLLGNVIGGLYKNNDGIIWVGTWGQGLNLVNPETNEVEHFSTQQSGNHHLSNDFIHTVFKDSGGDIWLGTRNGIFIYDKPRNQFHLWNEYFKRPNFPTFLNTRIYDIIQDVNKNCWIATSNGLYRVNVQDSEVEVFNIDEEINHRLSANLIYSLLEDSEGLIWIATINGLDVYNPQTKEITYFKKEAGGLNSNFIISLCEDGDGNIWIGSNAYANVFDKKSSEFGHFGEEQGLPSNYIYAIKKDQSNNLWFATGSGLCKFNPDNNELEIYTPEDGLQSLEFNLRAACMCPDGQMLFGGMNGFNTFYPDSIAGNPNVPNLVFTSFRKTTNGIQEKINIEQGAKEILSHKVQSFTIEFAALEFTNPQKNNYAYKMEGVSTQWNDIGNRRFVPFFALPAGEYTFSVKGSNNDGVWADKVISFSLVVLPPWWRSVYAYWAYLILITLMVITFIKIREQKLKNDKIVLKQKVEERTLQIDEQNQLIISQNEALKELNKTKDKFFSIIGHDLGNHFNIIVGFSEVLLSGFRKMKDKKIEMRLQSIHNSSNQAHDLLVNLLTWARVQRNAIQFKPENFDVNVKVRELILFHEETALKKNILIEVFTKQKIVVNADVNMFSTVYRNLLANALKFTPADGEISISTKSKNGFCEIKICDTGIGIPQENIEKIFRIDNNVSSTGTEGEKGSGLGLVICKEFVKKHGGQIWVESEVGAGSTFIFTMPLGHS
ncbi:two-component regulator propeller domain-containing protein [uncultured Draconibacterium sp.]|uniref:ligand-binding sensor domain-containing protein n=1 Tax=uncultured Draconibacterium sp. TaxID=1573823 RepID=UPI003217C100